ncbi:MAG: sugar transferase [Patescibacteria group bacterium]|nr:sugar transferase [bacterium]MDZ4221429.1 sugar transferase [Patescibacteria group bacterium]
MKRAELLFSFLLIPVDYLMLLGAGLFAYFLRYETVLTDVRPAIFEIPVGAYIKIIALVALIWLPIFALAGMYTIRATTRLADEFKQAWLGCSTGLVVVVLLIFFRHELFGSRFIVLAGYLASIVFVFLGRAVIVSIKRSLYLKNIGSRRVVVFGGGQTAHRLVRSLKDDPAAGFLVVRHFRTLDDASLGMLANIARHGQADLVLYAEQEHGRREVSRLYEFCREHHFDFSYAADAFEAAGAHISVTDLGGSLVVHLRRTPLDGWGRIVKRIADVCFSVLALALLVPVFWALAITIKVDSPGPVFVRLSRMGEGGRRFRLYKFRSMVQNADKMKRDLSAFNEREDGPLFKMKNDPRITRVGKIIRRLSIDELPNFINVLKGDLSLVGPRPHEPEEVGKYTGSQKRLLTIKPGVTGLAQISGRSDLEFSEEARLDLFYIENWSFWMDLQILLRTPWAVIRGKNAV